MNSIQSSITVDLKMANLILGLQSHGSKHPCAFCDAENPRSASDWKVGELRTLGSIRRNLQNWRDSGSVPSRAKEFFNCVSAPLFNGEDTRLSLGLLSVPELHLLLGPTNDLVKHLAIVWGNHNGKCSHKMKH